MKDPDSSDVPCNGCTACCRGDAVRILPHEDATQWKTEPHPYISGARMLAHQLNGDCVYLGDGGCAIHHAKPQQCREMDCRVIANRVSWTQARKMDDVGTLNFEVWRRGRDLLKDIKRRPIKNWPLRPIEAPKINP